MTDAASGLASGSDPAGGAAPTIRRRRRRPILREVPPAIWLVAAVSGAIGAASGCHPVGGPVADAVVTGLFAAVAVLMASQATWPTLLLGAAMVAAVGSTPERVVGVAAAVLVVVLERRKRVEPFGAAVIATVVVHCALRFPAVDGERVNAGMAALAIVPMALSGLFHAPKLLKRQLVLGLVAVVAFTVLGGGLAAVTTLRARHALNLAQDQVLLGLDSARAGDRDASISHFRESSIRFSEADSATSSWYAWPSRQVPGVAQQVRALGHVAHAGSQAASVAYEGASRIDPDRLRLVDGRIDVEAIRSYLPIFADLAQRTRRLRTTAPVRRTWLLPPVQDGLDHFESTVAKADASAATAAEAARVAPIILGADGPRRYFVMFVTPAEARASGGFMGNYAILTIDDGRLHLGPIGRLLDLNHGGDPAAKKITAPADYVSRYSRFDVAHYWENVTMSPDFPSVGRVVSQLYPLSGGSPIDGVLRLDPVALQGLLQLTGPVHVKGLSAPIDETNVVPFLLRGQYELFDDQSKRIDLLGDVGRATFDRLTTGLGATPQKVASAMSPRVRADDLALWMADPKLQAFVHRIGADADVAPTRGDSFGVVTQNAGASKIDSFLERTISYRATVDASTGQVHATALVTLHNTAPAKGLPFYVIGNLVDLPFGTSRSYVSIYSSLAMKKVTLDGRPTLVRPERELGRNVYSSFIDIGPGQRRTVRIDLAGTIDLHDGHYRFGFVPQVQAIPDHVSWQATVTDGDLLSVGSHGLSFSGTGTKPTPPSRHGRSVIANLGASQGPWDVDLGIAGSTR